MVQLHTAHDYDDGYEAQTGATMKIKNAILSAAITVNVLAACAGAGEEELSSAQVHAKQGVAAAVFFKGYASLCDLDMEFRNVNVPRKARIAPTAKSAPVVKSAPQAKTAAKAVPARAPSKLLPPMQVFDNFYFIGNAGVSAWLLGDEDGYILIDAMTSNQDAQSIIEAGILELGLDPNKIEYLLITHGHGDHYGGYRYLRDKYGMHLVMGKPDWRLASFLGEHPRFGPPPQKLKNDIEALGGETLQAGNTSLEIHLTPGHTMGTISPVFTVVDGEKSYRAALWGGTGFNFGPNLNQLAAYAQSARRFGQNAEKENIEVFFSNHGRRDGSPEKMSLLADRQPGDAHPFVMGERARDIYVVLEQCALAQRDRLAAAKKDG